MPKTIGVALLAALAGLSATAARAADLDLERDYEPRQEIRTFHDAADTRIDYAEHRHEWRGDWREGRPYRGIVEAQASYASNDVPYQVAEWRARRSAIDAWSIKVERMFGPRFAHWRAASDKSLSCDRVSRNAVACSVSARPERSWRPRMWGAWNWRREAY